MTGRLSGMRVLVPARSGERLAAALEAEGAIVTAAPAIVTMPPEAPASLAASLARLGHGAYDWLAVTSATTVAALGSVAVPESTRIAAVGTATADALRGAGHRVDYMPAREQSAAGMLREWPRWGATVLLPQSSIAAPTLADGLRALGFAVDAVTAYRTISLALPSAVVAGVASGAYDAVVLTSGSVARSVSEQLLVDRMRVVCIGEPSASVARELGMTVDAVAARPEPDAIVDALVTTIIEPRNRTGRP